MNEWILSVNPVLPVTPIGWAGWASFFTSGGVLVWLLFKHLPAKDQQMKEFHDAKDALSQAITAKHEHVLEVLAEKYEKRLEVVAVSFQRESKETKDEFKAALNVVLVHCEKETIRLMGVFQNELAQIMQRTPP